MDRERKKLQSGFCYLMRSENQRRLEWALGWLLGSLELGIQVDITSMGH